MCSKIGVFNKTKTERENDNSIKVRAHKFDQQPMNPEPNSKLASWSGGREEVGSNSIGGPYSFFS